MRRKHYSNSSLSRISASAIPSTHPKDTVQKNTQYSYSYTTESCTHSISEIPHDIVVNESLSQTVPVDIFSKQASAMQAISRYLVDEKSMGFTDAARMLGRNPKSIWTSYHQAEKLENIDENTLKIPIAIFLSAKSPLEALVSYLKSLGLRNVEIARTLKLDPKTVWTAAKRAEVRA